MELLKKEFNLFLPVKLVLGICLKKKKAYKGTSSATPQNIESLGLDLYVARSLCLGVTAENYVPPTHRCLHLPLLGLESFSTGLCLCWASGTHWVSMNSG